MNPPASPRISPRSTKAPTPVAHSEPRCERLQKVLAAAGLGSRRHCEELILLGRVEIDRKLVTELGTKVDPQTQEVRVDGQPLPRTRKVYYLVNKPEGVLSTNDDPSGRPRVIDLLPQTKERLFTVGRLDMSSEGLMLVTNDGELANRLAHPRYGVEKTYHVLVAGVPEREILDKLRAGIHLAEGFAKVVSVRIKSVQKKSATLEIVLDEGRNREIRRLLARVQHKVLRLKRVAIGGVKLKDLAPGEFRRLMPDELKLLHAASRRGQRKSGPTKVAAPTVAPPVAASSIEAKPSAPSGKPSAPRGRRSQPRVGRATGGRPAKSPRR